MLADKLFHARGPATAKFCVPSTVLVLGTTRHWLPADRRCRRPATVVTGTQSLARYGGASPCRHSSPACTWFDYAQEASKVHSTPARCDQTSFWILSQHALLHCELSAASLANRRWHRTANCCSNSAGCWRTHAQASSWLLRLTTIWRGGADGVGRSMPVKVTTTTTTTTTTMMMMMMILLHDSFLVDDHPD